MVRELTGWRWFRVTAAIGLSVSAMAVGQVAEPIRPDRVMQTGAARGSGFNLVSRIDAYGNARAIYNPVRTTNLFVDAGLGARMRPTAPLGLSRLPGAGLAGAATRSPDPVAGLASSAIGGSHWQRRAFASYGGFARRNPRRQWGDISLAFERRYALVTATGLNAPVHRASQRPGLPTMTASSLDRQPFVTTSTKNEEASGVALDEWLRGSSTEAHARARAQGASAFRAGEYRRAASAYEIAVMLDPGDVRARVGELFSYLALGATATATVSCSALARRPENPFVLDLNMMDAFGDRTDALRIRANVLVDRATDPGTLALRSLALWYLGDRVEAARVSRLMPRGREAGHFARWRERLEAAAGAAEDGDD